MTTSVDEQVDPPRVPVVGLHRAEELATRDGEEAEHPDLPVDAPGRQRDRGQDGGPGGQPGHGGERSRR